MARDTRAARRTLDTCAASVFRGTRPRTSLWAAYMSPVTATPAQEQQSVPRMRRLVQGGEIEAHLQLGGAWNFGDGLYDAAHDLGRLGLRDGPEEGPQLCQQLPQRLRILLRCV